MIQDWILKIPLNLIANACEDSVVCEKLLASIVMQESAGDQYATRYEDHYKWIFNTTTNAERNRISLATELVHQKTSWGLCQLMGALCRELGFEGPLVKMCEPELNLKYAVKHLEKLYKKYDGDIKDILAAYNAGSVRKNNEGQYVNLHYVVMANSYYIDLFWGDQC